MDIIDPTLESSAQRAEIDETKVRSAFWQVIALTGIALVAWIIYSTYSSRLDTRPKTRIDIDPGLQKPSDAGRPDPISDTI